MHKVESHDFHHWPIRPNRMFYYNDERTKLADENSGNLSGVFSNDHVIGWCYDVMCRFEEKFGYLHPITLIQKAPESLFDQGDKPGNDDYKKLDIDHIYNQASPICSKCREIHGRDMCNAIDFTVLQLMMDSSEEEMRSWDSKRGQAEFSGKLNKMLTDKVLELAIEGDTLANILIEQQHEIHCHLTYSSSFAEGEHPYIRYTCPCTYLYEVAFPVYVSGKVSAVLLAGQYAMKNQFGDIQSQLEMIAVPFNPNSINPRLLSDNELTEIISFYQGELCKLEESLSNRVGLNIEGFMSNLTKTFENRFDLKPIWDNVVEAIEEGFLEMMPKLSIPSFELFKIDQRKPFSKDWQLKSFSPKRANIHFRAQSLLRTQLNDDKCRSENGCSSIPYNSRHFPRVLRDGAQGVRESTILITYQHHDVVPLAMLATPSVDLSDSEIDQLIILFSRIFPSLYSKLLSVQTSKEKDDYDMTLKYIGHELGQFVYSINTCMDHLSNIWSELYGKYKEGENFLSTAFGNSNGKFELYFRDANEFMKNIVMISNSAKMRSFTRKIEKKPYLFFIEGYRYADYFRVAMRDRNMYLSVINGEGINPDDPLRPALYGDTKYIELAAYNLLGNATKYGHQGTRIYFDCCKKDEGIDTPHILTVRNYGPCIEQEKLKSIFEMGVRLQPDEEGEGFGLFFVKEIAEEHAGNAWCECDAKAISKYNVSYLKGGIDYLKSIQRERELNRKESGLLDNLDKELTRLIDEGIFYKIVNGEATIFFNGQNESPKEFLKQLVKPTFEVTFYLEIPPKHIQDIKDKE